MSRFVTAMGIESWVERPLRVALALSEGKCEGTYYEACIIIASAISGIASHVWPGDDVGDRSRFVEAWIRYAPPDSATRINVPLLFQTLSDGKHAAEKLALQERRPSTLGADHDCLVLTSDSIDGDEAELRALLPNASVPNPVLRRHAYAAVFYKHVRCGLSHQYELGGAATPWPMTSNPNPRVSYSNQIREAPLPDGDATADRLIHFHVPWLAEVTREMARNVARVAPQGNLAVPLPWWIKAP